MYGTDFNLGPGMKSRNSSLYSCNNVDEEEKRVPVFGGFSSFIVRSGTNDGQNMYQQTNMLWPITLEV